MSKKRITAKEPTKGSGKKAEITCSVCAEFVLRTILRKEKRCPFCQSPYPASRESGTVAREVAQEENSYE